MTRIFDALKKALPAHPGPAPQISTVPPPSPPAFHGAPLARATPTAPSGGYGGRPVEVRRGFPLVTAADLGEEEMRQMIALRVRIESVLTERSPRIVIFLGSQRGEGTSTVVHQFCVTLAREPKTRVLLVDANIERPTIEVDPARRTASWTHRPRRTASEDDASGEIALNLHAIEVPQEHRRGHVYPLDAARELIESVSGAYDWIVLDGPPVLEAPDSAALSSIADGAVLVVRAGRTKRPVLARAVDVLRKAGARVLGSVLNGRQLEIPEFIYRRL